MIDVKNVSFSAVASVFYMSRKTLTLDCMFTERSQKQIQNASMFANIKMVSVFLRYVPNSQMYIIDTACGGVQ